MFENQFVFQDATKNQALLNNNRQAYYRTLIDRSIRLNSARVFYMQSNFPQNPLNTQQELIAFCEKFKNIDALLYDKFNKKLIDGDFLIEGTPEWSYRQQYDQAFQNFFWPNAEEITIRQAEETELEKFL